MSLFRDVFHDRPSLAKRRLGFISPFHRTLNVSSVVVTILIMVRKWIFLCFCIVRVLGANFSRTWIKELTLKLKIVRDSLSWRYLFISRNDKVWRHGDIPRVLLDMTLVWSSFQRNLSSISPGNIYIPKGKNSGCFLFFPKGELVYLREQSFLSSSYEEKEGRQ